MKFRVTHTTHYAYARAVSLGPHIIRLHPRADANLLLQDYRCVVEPKPNASRYCLDYTGNVILRAEFTTPTHELTIVSSFVAMTLNNGNELMVVSDELPVRYNTEAAAHLAAYRQSPALDSTAQALLEELRQASQGQPLVFLDALNTYIYKHIQREIREQGEPQTPGQTLRQQRGACRDLTLLFMSLCQAQGFAARFVSGYQAKAEDAHGQRFLHAWPEVYVPGVGWCGYDPTHASKVSDAHVAVAASHSATGAAPVEGSYYGEAVASTLAFKVSIDAG
jgi:transglutaminase-like putative cysteine protease